MKEKIKGQIIVGIPLAAAFAAATFIFSGVTSYFTSQLNTQSQITDAKEALAKDISDTKVNIATTDATVAGIDKRLQRIEDKLDALNLKLK